MSFDPLTTRLEVLARLVGDRERGELLPLADYQALFKGHEDLVASEWTKLAPVPSAAPGQRMVGPYRLERELGRGGQGIVWLARDERLGRQVALKLVPASPLFEGFAPRFRREAEIASRLDHPSICSVYDVGSSDGVAWIAMRYVEGEPLAHRIARGDTRRDLPGTLALVETLARALHAAHEAGVIHRDVKPGNVLIAQDGAPVLCDFGLARSMQGGPELTRTGQTLGTPAYLAPEVLRGWESDRRVDVWSLGVLLYESLTGGRPFQAPTADALARAILEVEPVDLVRSGRGHSRDLAVVVATALAKEPERRYQTALDLAQDLCAVREGTPVSVRPSTIVERLARWARRKPALASALAGLFLALVAGLSVALVLLSRTRDALSQKRSALDDVTRLADGRRVRNHLTAERELWPAVPERERDLRAWLAGADELLERRESHLGTLDQLARTTGDDTRDWHAELLGQLLADLELLEAAKLRIVARLEWALDLERRTLEEPRRAWQAARERVAGNARFMGLEFAPQRGLVPLGPDPVSGLEEFVVLETGDAPARGPDGNLELTGSSGIVLVLLPGGKQTVGAWAPNDALAPGEPHVDPLARDFEGPPHEVELTPFFLSKFELTQGQWRRHTGSNPSYFQGSGTKVPPAEEARHPVESVSHVDALRVLAELSLALPTEAQWEHGARAGTATVWWVGDDERALAGAANFADRFAREHGGSESWPYSDWLDDGAAVHASIGSFRANAFGLHDVHGNVREWCADTWEDWQTCGPPRPGDGLHQGSETLRVFRGGDFAGHPRQGRSAHRDGYPAENYGPIVGLRPARALN